MIKYEETIIRLTRYNAPRAGHLFSLNGDVIVIPYARIVQRKFCGLIVAKPVCSFTICIFSYVFQPLYIHVCLCMYVHIYFSLVLVVVVNVWGHH